jgi:hypothetical protein
MTTVLYTSKCEKQPPSMWTNPVPSDKILAMPLIRQAVTAFPLQEHGFNPRSGHVGCVVGKVVLGQIFFKYFRFCCKLLFHQLLCIH